MSALADFTAHLLVENGALVEPTSDGLEVLLPADVARALEIPEHASLSFLGERREGFSVSYDSDILKKMAGLMGNRGKFAAVALGPSSMKLEKMEERLGDKLVFQNAVFHVESKDEKPISYFLGYSKYSARSDDRQEGIVGCVVNELNLSVQRTTSGLLDFIANEAGEPTGQAEWESGDKVLKAFWQAQLKIVKEALSDFLVSMERRMNRDIRRVHDYYQTLMNEHHQALARKSPTPDERARAESKIAAIERELNAKIQDIIGKFRIDLLLEPISFVRIETISPIFWLSVKRRKAARQFPLAFNPLLKSLDPLPCEACYYPRKGYYVCDDHLHIVCRECFAPCVRCDRVYCSACYPKGCPRCLS